ncbi:MAG TPA: hypothetical protein VNI83_05355 [Vicinamibacterales bacterium]|nr:hypothetical protein [Vicinamibacterales bacterium]
MPRACRTCATPAAEAAIVAGEPYSKVAKHFGISDDALRYHMRLHYEPPAAGSSPRSSAVGGADLDTWRAFAGELYDALAPWPDARQAAADRLREWAAKGGGA